MGSSHAKQAPHGSRPRSEAKREAAQISVADKATLQLKLERDNLLAAMHRYDRVAALEHERARSFLRAGNKRFALYCLKREKMQQTQIDSVQGMLDNIQTMISTVEMANIEVEVIQSLEKGKVELERLNKMLNIDDIERLMNETAESIDQVEEVNKLLSQPIDGVQDDEALLRELEEVPAADALLSRVNVPTHAVKAPTSADDVKETSAKAKEGRTLVGA